MVSPPDHPLTTKRDLLISILEAHALPGTPMSPGWQRWRENLADEIIIQLRIVDAEVS